MLVTLSGIVMLVSSVQFLNAEPPMLVTPSGIVTLESLVQPENAHSQMIFAFSEITQEVIDWLFAFTNTK